MPTGFWSIISMKELHNDHISSGKDEIRFEQYLGHNVANEDSYHLQSNML